MEDTCSRQDKRGEEEGHKRGRRGGDLRFEDSAEISSTWMHKSQMHCQPVGWTPRLDPACKEGCTKTAPDGQGVGMPNEG